MAEVKATVRSEYRTDRAERNLDLVGGGSTVIEYMGRKYQRREGYVDDPRSISVESITIIWDQGILSEVIANGKRVKKSGAPGMIRDRLYWKIVDGSLEEDRIVANGRAAAPVWLVALVTANSTPPALKPLRTVGR